MDEQSIIQFPYNMMYQLGGNSGVGAGEAADNLTTEGGVVLTTEGGTTLTTETND